MTNGGQFELFAGVAMLAVFALAAGGVRLLRHGQDRRKAILMLVAALVLFGNVLIWTL